MTVRQSGVSFSVGYVSELRVYVGTHYIHLEINNTSKAHGNSKIFSVI